jgi:hypothetical protein
MYILLLTVLLSLYIRFSRENEGKCEARGGARRRAPPTTDRLLLSSDGTVCNHSETILKPMCRGTE